MKYKIQDTEYKYKIHTPKSNTNYNIQIQKKNIKQYPDQGP